MMALADYRVFRMSADRYPAVQDLRRKHSIDARLEVYAVFPEAFDRMLLRQIRTTAAQRGRAGRVFAARIAWSASAPTGVEVLQVRVRVPGAQ
jgi:hypothetical protein